VIRDKAVSISQSDRQKKHIDVVRGNDKAARITISSLSGKQVMLTERWGSALAMYCDYFIRY